MSARWVNFHVALTNNPISAGFSVERLLSLVGFATRFIRMPRSGNRGLQSTLPVVATKA